MSTRNTSCTTTGLAVGDNEAARTPVLRPVADDPQSLGVKPAAPNVDIGAIHVELTPAELKTLSDQCLALTHRRKMDAETWERATSQQA